MPDSGQESRLPPLDKPPQHVARCAVQAEGIFVLENHQAHQLHLDVQLLVILEIKAKNKGKIRKKCKRTEFIDFLYIYIFFFFLLYSFKLNSHPIQKIRHFHHFLPDCRLILLLEFVLWIQELFATLRQITAHHWE